MIFSIIINILDILLIYYIALLIKNSRFDEAREILDNTVITKKTSNRNVIELIKSKHYNCCIKWYYPEFQKNHPKENIFLGVSLYT